MQEYSIADAKAHLPRIVHEVEKSGRIHLTRYGKPVAVILSEAEYSTLKQGKKTTAKEALQTFLANDEFKDVDVDTHIFDQDRAKQQGREIQL